MFESFCYVIRCIGFAGGLCFALFVMVLGFGFLYEFIRDEIEYYHDLHQRDLYSDAPYGYSEEEFEEEYCDDFTKHCNDFIDRNTK